jgi:hypothetical protein
VSKGAIKSIAAVMSAPSPPVLSATAATSSSKSREVAVSPQMFQEILPLIARLRAPPAPA